jgi:peptidoglycan/xylan/chitin deacetylase (PgdA/CDA1 family)
MGASRLVQPPRMRLSGTVVLTYHGFAETNDVEVPRRERKYWTTLSRFRRQVDLLVREQFQGMTLADFWDTPPAVSLDRAIVVTFDDGRASDYQSVFPILTESRIRATFFLNTATVGTLGYLTWPQIMEMQRYGMSFQSHSHDHVYLSALSAVEVRRQLESSKRILEDRLGAPVRFLAAPYGDTNRLVVPVARELGYSAICTSRNWPAHPGLPSVSRVVVYGTTTEREFRSLADRDAFMYCARAVRAGLLYVPKQLLGVLRKLRKPAMQEVSA